VLLQSDLNPERRYSNRENQQPGDTVTRVERDSNEGIIGNPKA